MYVFLKRKTMRLLPSEGLSSVLSRKNILLDNDFLSVLSSDIEAFDDFRKLTEGKSLLIVDPFTRFEFLQSVYLAERRIVLEKFLAHEMFIPATHHPSVFMPIFDNALKISWIYAHHKCVGASPVDLIIASRAVSQKMLVITKNRKDFPGFMFRVVGTLTRDEQDRKNGHYAVQTYSVLEFDKTGYDQAVENWREKGEKA